PKTYKSLDAVQSALEAKELAFPVLIKPRWGVASLGVYTADDAKELEVFYKKSIKDIRNGYLKYESAFTPDEMILFQEKLTGQEYGLDVINDLEGNFICVLPKSKLAMRAGETDLGKTVSPVRFRDIALQISNKLRHILILSIDCFEIKGRIYVIEMNGRISGHYPLSHLAGTNLPKQIIEWLEGRETNANNFKFREGVYMIKDLLPVILNKE
ncbi:MAG: ATP-grasp domain-containing protein, partial [Chitinophagaceae bacterium]